MMENGIDDDEYVAKLLKQDAKNTAKKYEMVGLDAFLPQRSRNGAPKPNTNFLRHIIRQTDSHNAALLAKEAEDSRSRLRGMNREREGEARRNKAREREKERGSRSAGRLSPPEVSRENVREGKRKRDHHSDDDEERDRRRRRRRREDEPRYSASKREREREHERERVKVRDTRREKRRCSESDGDDSKRKAWQSKGDLNNKRRHRNDSEEGHHKSRRKEESVHKHRRRRSHSKSASQSYSPHRRQKEPSRRPVSRSPSPTIRSPDRQRSKTTNETKYSKRHYPIPDSDSDPLEAIVGPLPPRAQPIVRSRGRGAHKANAMDERFSTAYNPSTDVHVDSDLEDDWGDALEALKDRQQYKQQGAERLKAAGFSDEQVKKWEKGDEKGEEDVRWAKSGEGREWDRGKVVDEDGDVELKAEWGRLT